MAHSWFVQVPGADSPHAHSGKEFRNEATGEHYAPNEQGLTIAGCMIDGPPKPFMARVVGLFQTEERMEEHQEEVGLVEEVLPDGVVRCSQAGKQVCSL